MVDIDSVLGRRLYVLWRDATEIATELTLFWPIQPAFGNLHRRVKLNGRLALHRVGDVAV